MISTEIDMLICRARKAYMGRSDYDGRPPLMSDSDIILCGHREAVMLCSGKDILAYYVIIDNGRLALAKDLTDEDKDS